MNGVIIVGTLLLISLLLAAMPRFSRPDIFFGVTVDPGFRESPEGVKIRRGYEIGIALSALTGVVVLVSDLSLQWMTVPFFLTTVAVIAGLAIGNSRARKHAVAVSPIREASISRRDDSLPGGWTAFLAPFVILLAAAAYLALNWESLPERIPTHWGLHGPDRWMNKNPSSVFGFLMVGASSCLILLFTAWAIVRTRRIAARGEAAVNESRFRNLNLFTVLATEYVIAILFAAIPILSAQASVSTVSTVTIVLSSITVLISIVMVLVMIHYGQGGSHLAGSAAGAGDRTPDHCWYWGLFYVNKNDPAFFVEKRFGLGYTLNFAHPLSWALLGGSLGLMLVGIILSK